MLVTLITKIKRDEVGTCEASLVTPKQSVHSMYIANRPSVFCDHKNSQLVGLPVPCDSIIQLHA